MTECQMGSGWDSEDWSILQHKVIRATAQHTCEECHRSIQKGEEYELYSIIQDGDFFTANTCLDCVSLRTGFFPDGYTVGEVRMRIAEQIYELRGVIDSQCILPLSEIARDWVFGLMEEEWEKTGGTK